MSKDSLAKTASKSWRCAGMCSRNPEGDPSGVEFFRKALARRWEVVATASIWATGLRLMVNMRSSSSSASDVGGCVSAVVSSSSSSSSMRTGKGPVLQARIQRVCRRRARVSAFASDHHSSHFPEHWDIFTLPVFQSISGLCSLSHEYPSMSFCRPRPVTARSERSE